MSYQCESGGDAAAYALGALGEQEAAAFARHLETCVVCRDELEAFTAVTDRLGLGVTQYKAPRRLRRAVLAEVRPKPSRARPSRPMFTLATGLAVVVLALAVAVDRLVSPSGTPTRTVVASVRGSGHAELKITGGRAELIVHGMPMPTGSNIYEVWLVRRSGGAPQPTSALFGVTSAGDGTVAVPGNARAIRDVLVTEEPAGGTKKPTTAPVIQARIT